MEIAVGSTEGDVSVDKVAGAAVGNGTEKLIGDASKDFVKNPKKETVKAAIRAISEVASKTTEAAMEPVDEEVDKHTKF